MSAVQNQQLLEMATFIIQCTETQSPFYVAAQLLRMNLCAVGEVAVKEFLLQSSGPAFLYIATGLALLQSRLPFVGAVVLRATMLLSEEERCSSICTMNLYILDKFGWSAVQTSSMRVAEPIEQELKDILHRGAPLLQIVRCLKLKPAPKASPPCTGTTDWDHIRNRLLRLPDGYFDGSRALDVSYDVFSYIKTCRVPLHSAIRVHSRPISVPWFITLLLSSLSAKDFLYKVSPISSQEAQKQFVLQALGDITKYDHLDSPLDSWFEAKNSALYESAIRSLLKGSWVPAFTIAIGHLYESCVGRSLSDVKRTATACGESFKCAADMPTQERLLSFIDLRESMCCLQRRVFLRFFVIAATPPLVDNVLLHLLLCTSASDSSNRFPNTSFSRRLLQSLSLTHSYTAFLEPLE